MRIFIHGTDKGNAALTALILVMVLSALLISLVTRINATKQFAGDYKNHVIRSIQESNRMLQETYAFH
jgi:hypothetical protein